VIRGFEECVKLLIEKGANLKHRDKTGKTPYHHAALCGHIGVLEDLIDQLDKPHAANQIEDLDGYDKMEFEIPVQCYYILECIDISGSANQH